VNLSKSITAMFGVIGRINFMEKKEKKREVKHDR